jgi:hypothetical protein
MTTNAFTQFRPSYPIFIVLFTRYRRLKMDEQVSPQCAIDTHTDPRDDGLRRLENGIELGLSRIIANLHELTSRVDAMPTRVAEILSNQHVASATHQSVSEIYKDCIWKFLADICRL